MPLYYFDIQDGDDLIEDNEGLWFPDFEAAEQEATEAAACIIRNMRWCNGLPVKITVQVRDEHRHHLMSASAMVSIQRNFGT
jgi:hypothetical protein